MADPVSSMIFVAKCDLTAEGARIWFTEAVPRGHKVRPTASDTFVIHLRIRRFDQVQTSYIRPSNFDTDRNFMYSNYPAMLM